MKLILTFLLAASLQGEPAPTLETVSARFLGVRFKTDALGEGKGQPDSDPLSRVDAFDCTTFIETVWAMQKTKPGQDWIEVLQSIRYRGSERTFTERLHFISRDWMAVHLQKGDLRDVTAEMGLPLQESRTLIDRHGWYAKKHPALLKDFEKRYPQEKPELVRVPYIRFGDALENAGALEKLKVMLGKAALLANFVRPNFDTSETIGTPIDITHQGLLMIQNGRIIIRHASLTLMHVGDEDFIEYLKFYRRHPTLKGFQLVQLL